ncbi:lactonase family protein [Rhizobium pusense]|uniref:lactonase family protein n=1 Tax=Agrobacterium pusense TaxID=648995 RepID=UPI001C6E555B|nr:lactonase family protein [Agrobacterium pusense]MBW9076357.1 lactonase family protein [Agrobacterium pusense]
MEKTFAFIGNLSRNVPPGDARGICTYTFDAETGHLDLQSEFSSIDNLSYLVIDENRHRLYAAVEIPTWSENFVAAFAINPVSGALSYINMQPTLGNTTCHLGFDQTGQFLFASNWTVKDSQRHPGKAVVAFAIRKDGGLEPAFTSAAHSGPDAILASELDQHCHCAIASPDNSTMFVCDLGLDRIMAYKRPEKGEILALAETPFTQLPNGSGPRHLVFHPDGRSAYVINELSSTISVLRYERAYAKLTAIQTISTLPSEFKGDNSAAEILLSPDGRFVYGSNRGHNSIVSYAVKKSGEIEPMGWTPTEGNSPRHFVIDPTGQYVFASHQKGGGVVVLRRNRDTGVIGDVENRLSLASPMRVVFARFGLTTWTDSG